MKFISKIDILVEKLIDFQININMAITSKNLDLNY